VLGGRPRNPPCGGRVGRHLELLTTSLPWWNTSIRPAALADVNLWVKFPTSAFITSHGWFSRPYQSPYFLVLCVVFRFVRDNRRGSVPSPRNRGCGVNGSGVLVRISALLRVYKISLPHHRIGP